MDVMNFVRQSFNEVYERINASCQGLSAEEMKWRPANHANPIAFILWHVARAEDRGIRAIIQRGEEVWDAERWYERFGLSKERAGIREDAMLHDREAFPPPQTLLGYLAAVHRRTLESLAHIGMDDLDRVTDPARPYRTVSAMLRHLIVHASNHHGQIDYLRGLMQAGWDLTPGTGIKQD